MKFASEIERARFRNELAVAVKTGSFQKLAADISPYIKVRLYENAVDSAILKQRDVSPADLIPEEGANDTYFVYGDVEQPTQEAIGVNFRGQAATTYAAGRRFKIPLGRHITPVVVKSVDEMLAWDYDLIQDLGSKDIFYLHNLRDKKFLWAVQNAILLNTKWTEFPLGGAAGVVRVEKAHFNELTQLLETGTRTGIPNEDVLALSKFLMSQTMFNDMTLWDSEEAGAGLVADMVINGYPVKKVLGRQFVTSIKAKLYVESDPVAIITYADHSVEDDTVVIDGVTFTAKDSPSGDVQYDVKTDGATQATELTRALNAKLGNEYVVTNPSAGVVRIRKIYDPAWRRFSPTMTVTETETNATLSSGHDRWDHIYGFPEPEFIGESIKIIGREVDTDIWKDRGEKTEEIKRRSSEWSGGAIGNTNAVSLIRLQGFEFTG